MRRMPLSLTASQCAKLAVLKHKLKERASMSEATINGVDLKKRVPGTRDRCRRIRAVPHEANPAAVRRFAARRD